MLASMTAGLNAIVPLFILIGLGYFARHTVLDARMLPALNTFVYYFAVPALLFKAASEQSLDTIINGAGLSAFILAAGLTAAVTVMVCYYHFKITDFTALVMRGLTATFANFAYMGIPLIMAVVGETANGAMVAIILAGNLCLIAGTQIIIESYKQGRVGIKPIGIILDKALLRNPIFLSTALGLLYSGLAWPLPTSITTTLTMLAPAAIPVALFCLGAGLQFTRTSLNALELSWLIVVKLVIHPALTLIVFKLMGIDDPNWLITAVLLTALPTGALAHVIALKYHHFATETAQAVVLSTLLSLISVAIWVTIML